MMSNTFDTNIMLNGLAQFDQAVANSAANLSANFKPLRYQTISQPQYSI